MCIGINHEYTRDIVCPYCGYEFYDSWEYNPNEENLGLIECLNEECGKSFYTYRDIDITYSTEEARYGTCRHCEADKVVIEDYHSSVGSYKDLCIPCGLIEKERLHREYSDKISNRNK